MNQIENWQPIYQELAELIGKEGTLKIYQRYRGLQITFPKRIWDRSSEGQLIYQAYLRGEKVSQLAIEHQYSEKTIRRIILQFSE